MKPWGSSNVEAHFTLIIFLFDWVFILCCFVLFSHAQVPLAHICQFKLVSVRVKWKKLTRKVFLYSNTFLRLHIAEIVE